MCFRGASEAGRGTWNTVIFTVIDRFSKSVSRPKLPSALETTNILVSQHIHSDGGGTTVLRSGLAGILQGPGHRIQSDCWIPSPVQQPDRAG